MMTILRTLLTFSVAIVMTACAATSSNQPNMRVVAGERGTASAGPVHSEDAFIAACLPHEPLVIAGLWRGTFESGDFVFPDALGFASDPGPFAFNPAAKVMLFDGVNDAVNRRRIDDGPRNGVGGWSYVWRVTLLVDSDDCVNRLRLHRILDLQTLTTASYEDIFRRSQRPGTD